MHDPNDWYAAFMLSDATDAILPPDPFFGHDALTPGTDANMRDQVLDLTGCLDAPL